MTRVAVLGTGIMGSAMARNLLEAGLAVTVWDRSPEARPGWRGTVPGRPDRLRTRYGTRAW